MIPKTFTRWQQNQAQKLADMFDNLWNKTGKNFKPMYWEYEWCLEIRGGENNEIRVIYDPNEKEIKEILHKPNHKNTPDWK